MKFTRAGLLRTATAVAGAAALATTLTVTAVSGPAKASTSSYIELCNYLSGTTHAIDVWSGSNWYGKVWHDQCAPVYVPYGQSTFRAQFYLNGTGQWVGGYGLDTHHDYFIGFSGYMPTPKLYAYKQFN